MKLAAHNEDGAAVEGSPVVAQRQMETSMDSQDCTATAGIADRLAAASAWLRENPTVKVDAINDVAGRMELSRCYLNRDDMAAAVAAAGGLWQRSTSPEGDFHYSIRRVAPGVYFKLFMLSEAAVQRAA